MIEIHWIIILEFRVCACKVGQGGGRLFRFFLVPVKGVSDRFNEIKLKRQKNNKYAEREVLIYYST